MNSEPGLIEVTVNGESRAVPAGWSVEDLVRSLDIRSSHVAVEIDRRILRREEWPSQTLCGGCRLEIIHFVGGGAHHDRQA